MYKLIYIYLEVFVINGGCCKDIGNFVISEEDESVWVKLSKFKN